jgi:prepilin-type N-terminal cleavage/methylation domain-containing protein/prepilin-type processing-associated H-X9-DG protein
MITTLARRQPPPPRLLPESSAPHSRRRDRGKFAGGFTLVELLVVIGIVLVLLALLMPAISNARQKATTAVCASNMRQVHQATMQFVQDHEGRMPVNTWVQETVQTTSPNYQKVACWVNVENGPAGGLINFEVGGLWPYIGTRGDVASRKAVMNCPGDTDERTLRAGQRSIRNFSYSYNSNIRDPLGDVGSGHAIRLAAVLHPAEKIMIYEELGPNDAWCTAPHFDVDDIPAGRHGSRAARNAKRITGPGAVNVLPGFFRQGRGNQCFFDGHVELISPQWIVEGKGSNTDFRSWGPLTIEKWPDPTPIPAPPAANN